MKTKQISKMLAPLSGIMSFMLAIGVMTIPATATEMNAEGIVYEESAKTDYATYINSTAEKNGFKVTISKITASKNNMNVTALVECPQDITDEVLDNSIFVFTVKKSTCESGRGQRQIIDNKTIQVNFEVTSFDEIPKNAELRFDVIIPEYNLNAWVTTNADLSKNFDKIIEKDINMYNDKAKITYNKVETDVLGTTIYFKEEDYENNDYENRYSDSDSKILVKCDDKLYGFDSADYNYNEDGREGRIVCRDLTYDKIKNAESVTLIPIICNLKNKDIDEIYNSRIFEEYDDEFVDNVNYQKKFKFADGKDGEVTKVERKDDKVKFYMTTDSEKKSMLMAAGIDGWSWSEDGNLGGRCEKTIYKDSENEYGYIVEFGNVYKDAQFNMWIDDTILGHSSDFELGQEVTVK